MASRWHFHRSCAFGIATAPWRRRSTIGSTGRLSGTERNHEQSAWHAAVIPTVKEPRCSEIAEQEMFERIINSLNFEPKKAQPQKQEGFLGNCCLRQIAQTGTSANSGAAGRPTRISGRQWVSRR